MEITEETKIKDLIPEGYEFDSVGDIVYKNSIERYGFPITIKPIEKKFNDYVHEYRNELIDNEYDGADEGYLAWRIENKLGLIWHIVRDKSSFPDWDVFVNVVDWIVKDEETFSYEEYKNFFPPYFKQTLKEDLYPKK